MKGNILDAKSNKNYRFSSESVSFYLRALAGFEAIIKERLKQNKMADCSKEIRNTCVALVHIALINKEIFLRSEHANYKKTVTDRLEEAERRLTEVLRKRTLESRTLIHLATVKYHLGKFDECIAYLNEAIRISTPKEEDYIDALFNKGMMLNHLKRFEEALDCFNTVLFYGDEDPTIYIYLGNSYLNLQHYERSFEYYNNKRLADNPISLSGKAICNILLNDYDSAYRYVNQSLRLFGIDESVENIPYNNLDKFKIIYKKLVVESILIKSIITKNEVEKNRLLDVALEISRKYSLDLYGPSLFKSILLITAESYESARDLLKNIEKTNKFKLVYYLLGLCFYNSGRIDEGSEQFQRSLEFDSNFALSRMAENQINIRKKSEEAKVPTDLFDYWGKHKTILVILMVSLAALVLYSIYPNPWNAFNVGTDITREYEYQMQENGLTKNVTETITERPNDNRQIVIAIIIAIIVLLIWPSLKTLKVSTTSFEIEKNELEIPTDSKILMSWIKIERFAFDLKNY